MTFTVNGPTETELLDWIRANLTNLWSESAVDQILEQFDFAEKGTPSRNSRTKVAIALDDPGPDAQPFTRATPEQAARNLIAQFTITHKAATPVVDLPDPVVVTRHQCPYCRRYTRADPTAVTRHMRACFHNPGLRCCKTCTHHQDGNHPEDDESCTHPDGPEPEDFSFPVLNCPLWEAQNG